MVNHLATADVLDDGAVAGGIGQRQVQRRLAVFARHLVGDDRVRLTLERRDRLVHGGEIVQHILRPQRDRQSRLVATLLRILRFHQPQQVGHQPLLVHAIGGRHVVAGGHHAAVARSPGQRFRTGQAGACDATRQHVEVGRHIDLPVHRARSDHIAVVAPIHRTRAGQCRRDRRCQRHGQHCLSLPLHPCHVVTLLSP